MLAGLHSHDVRAEGRAGEASSLSDSRATLERDHLAGTLERFLQQEARALVSPCTGNCQGCLP